MKITGLFPGMKPGAMIAALLLSLLFCSSLVLSLSLFGFDRGIRSWNFMDRRISEAEAILNDREVFSPLMSKINGLVMESFNSREVFLIRGIIEEAMLKSFTPQWMIKEIRKIHESSRGIMDGGPEHLQLRINLESFRKEFETLLVQRLDISAVDANQAVRQIPQTLDVRELSDEAVFTRIEEGLRAYPFYAAALMYLVPFIICLFFLLVRPLRVAGFFAGISFIISVIVQFFVNALVYARRNHVAASLLKEKSLQVFQPVFANGIGEMVSYINPALLLSAVSGLVIIVATWLLDLKFGIGSESQHENA